MISSHSGTLYTIYIKITHNLLSTITILTGIPSVCFDFYTHANDVMYYDWMFLVVPRARSGYITRMYSYATYIYMLNI